MRRTEMATVANKRQGGDLSWLVGLGVLVVIGLAAWVVQLTQGLDTLGVGQSVVWGAYIAAFFLLAGAGAGLVMLAAAGEMGALPVLRGMRRSLLLGALGSFIAAGVVILMDIGKPERVLSMLFSPNFKSMFVWDFYSLAISVVLVLACLLVAPKSKALLGVAGVAGIAVVVVEGWILSVSAGTPLWHSSLIPVVFLLEGLIVAISLVVLLGGVGSLRGTLASLLLVSLILAVVEQVTVSYGGDADAAAGMRLLSGGSMVPLYWGELALGVALPFVLLVWVGAGAGLAAVLAILGVFVAKLDLLVAGQSLPFMGAQAVYGPSLVEVAGVVGMVGLAAFLFVLGRRVIKAEA
jgi:dimethyl sulfoxide reductase membrane subunit